MYYRKNRFTLVYQFREPQSNVIGRAQKQKQEETTLQYLREQENRMKQTPLVPTPTKPHLAKLPAK